MSTNPAEICQRNAETAAARKEKLRADFQFTVRIVEELRDHSHPKLAHVPPFEPRVIWMRENDKEWRRR